jgi:hypothetical protein
VELLLRGNIVIFRIATGEVDDMVLADRDSTSVIEVLKATGLDDLRVVDRHDCIVKLDDAGWDSYSSSPG